MEAMIYRNTTEALREMLADGMGNLIDAVQALSCSVAPDLGPIGEREYCAPAFYGDPTLDRMQIEANWVVALSQRIERISAHLAALPQ